LTDEILAQAPPEYHEDPTLYPNSEWAHEPGALDKIRPFIADRGHTTQFLASRGVTLSNAARDQFLDAVVDELLAAYGADGRGKAGSAYSRRH
jgi:hypothetical protein